MDSPSFDPVDYIKNLPEIKHDFVRFVFHFLRLTHPVVRKMTEKSFPELQSDLPFSAILEAIIEHKGNSDLKLKRLLYAFNEKCRAALLVDPVPSQEAEGNSTPILLRNSSSETVTETVWSPNPLRDSVEKLPPISSHKQIVVSPETTPRNIQQGIRHFSSNRTLFPHSAPKSSPEVIQISSLIDETLPMILPIATKRPFPSTSKKAQESSSAPPRKRVREDHDLHILKFSVSSSGSNKLVCECGAENAYGSVSITALRELMIFQNVCNTGKHIVLLRNKGGSIIANPKIFTGFTVPSGQPLTKATDFNYDDRSLQCNEFIINRVAPMVSMHQNSIKMIIPETIAFLKLDKAIAPKK